ncbi:hypothetical protein D3C86_1995520 [compost metagenome]
MPIGDAEGGIGDCRYRFLIGHGIGIEGVIELAGLGMQRIDGQIGCIDLVDVDLGWRALADLRVE